MYVLLDFQVNGNSYDSSPVRATSFSGSNILIFRVYGYDLGYFASAGGTNTAIVECSSYNIVGGSGNMSIWASNAFGFFVAGCNFDNNLGGEHCLRYQGGTEGIITNNTFKKAASAKHLLTIRGDEASSYVSGRHVVNDNYFDSEECPVTILNTIAPQNKDRYEPIADVIWERNYSNALGGASYQLTITASTVTVRNNIFDATDGGQGAIVIIGYGGNTTGLPSVTDNHVYNNTFYSNSSNGLTGVYISNNGESPIDTVIKNNFMYAPNVSKSGEGNSGPNLYTDYGGDGTIVSNNTENWSSDETEIIDVFDHFTVQPPTDDPDDWVLQSDSYAVGAGIDVPVWSDYVRESLFSGSSRNLGALTAEEE